MSAATGSGATTHIWRRTFDDSEEQAGCVESLFPQRYFQVGAGRFSGEMTSINLDGVRLFRERVNRRLIQEGIDSGPSLDGEDVLATLRTRYGVPPDR